jgi:hypothetical protein
MPQKQAQRRCLLTQSSLYVHALVQCRWIESTPLFVSSSSEPLHDDYYNNNSNNEESVIRVELPQEVQEALKIDPPLELICVQQHRETSRNRRSSRLWNTDIHIDEDDDDDDFDAHDKIEKCDLPQLCLYTRKNAFILVFRTAVGCLSNRGGDSSSMHRGTMTIHASEPLDSLFELSIRQSILRMRPIPSSIVLAPKGSMVALLENSETYEYTVALHHSDGTVTTPLSFNVEALVDDMNERFVDFCFPSSNSGSLALLASTSILLLKSNGDVYVASPITLDGTVVSRAQVTEIMAYLDSNLKTEGGNNGANTPKWRQCKAAKQYFIDVFLGGTTSWMDPRHQFLTAQVLEHPQEQSAAQWPVKLQGPALLHSQHESYTTTSITVEGFGGSLDCLVGAAIGKRDGRVDLVAFSPTALLPRFAFEKPSDGNDLDDALFRLSAFVERIDLFGGKSKNVGADPLISSSAEGDRSCVVLIPDPVVDTLLHYVTRRTVITISSNAMRTTNRKLRGGAMNMDPLRTGAWCCLSSATDIEGVVVTNEARAGHELVARLKEPSGNVSGTTIRVDVTESKTRHEFASLLEVAAQGSDQQLLRLENNGIASASSVFSSATPLYEEIQPLVKKIHSGLSGMCRIVGSETDYRDISPEALAVAIEIKKKSDEEVVLPLLELKKIVSSRRESMYAMIENQKVQMKALNESMKTLKERQTSLEESIQLAESNALTLTERSSLVLKTCHDLMPTLTQAEYDYFQDLKRLKLKCTAMEKESKALLNAIESRCAMMDKSTISDSIRNMQPANLSKVNSTLKGQEAMLQKIRHRFANADDMERDFMGMKIKLS